MKQLSFRLKQDQLLKEEIEQAAVEKNIEAGVLLSIVGSLDKAALRMAGAKPGEQAVNEYDGPFEIVSGTGTISKHGCHIHVSISDQNGKVIGGHLKDGCVVKTTAEIVIGILEDIVYQREFDKETGFKELRVD